MVKKTKNVISYKMDMMKTEAMEAGDYSTVRKLMEIESELEHKLLLERLKGIFSGYGAAITGITIGKILVKIIKSK
jgi:hypothetical protein